MRYIKMAITAITLFLFQILTPVAGALPVVPPPNTQPKTDSPIIITGYAFSGTRLSYVQLFNTSNNVVDVNDWKVEYSISSLAEPVEIGDLEGKLKPGGYIVLGEKTSLPAADFTYILQTSSIVGNVTSIKLVAPELYLDATVAVKVDPATNYWRRNISTSTGNYLSTFTSFTPDSNFVLYGKGFYDFPKTTALQFAEILANPRNCSPLEQTADCFDFVKLHNPTTTPIDLSQFRLRIGYQGQTATSSNTFTLAGIVPAGGYFSLQRSSDNRPISLTNSGGFLWLEDTYGLKIYNSTVIEYPDASSDTKKGQAWAYDVSDGTWKWTLQPTYGDGPSVFVSAIVKPKVTASAAPTPCKEGQYRSEETNRCRSLASTVNAIVPCDDDQERNPETNRCRKIASTASSELTPCKEGQERNPETNRCRNATATSPPDTAFKAESVAETGKAFAGWWALGGIGSLALGYGAWEWRREVVELVQKAGSFFTSSK